MNAGIRSELPLTIRDVPPVIGARRLTGVNPYNGLPSGVHTGGAWLVNDGGVEWVYKPLDARPYANAQAHWPTLEMECLQEMEGEFLFPKNWTFESLNGRKFIKRRKAHLIPGDDLDWDYLSQNDLLDIEHGILTLNRKGWRVNDDICLALDWNDLLNSLFIYDLSNVSNVGRNLTETQGQRKYADWQNVESLFKACKADWLVALRHGGRRALRPGIEAMEDWTSMAFYKHVYASFNRPISLMWASLLPADAGFKHQMANWSDAIPHTWIFTKEPLYDEVISRYELNWAWSIELV